MLSHVGGAAALVGAAKPVLSLAACLAAAGNGAGAAVAVAVAGSLLRAWPQLTPCPFIAGPPPFSLPRALREDRTLISAAEYIMSALGQRFVESVPLNMERAWAESRPKTPLICLLSAGADPTKLIDDLAKRKKIKTLGVSMGQGQEVIARRYMATAAAEGSWVLLQNAHLGLGYLAEVESFLAKAEGIHDNFRLWITAEPHPAFPIGLLQVRRQ